MEYNYETEYFLIDKEYAMNEEEKCSLISLNPRDKKPFCKVVFNVRYKPNSFGFGSVIKSVENSGWSRVYKYNEHKYDYVVVLEKHKNNLIVFGNKIGERNIEINNDYTHIERGDHLLLDTYHDIVVHNVTCAKMKYAIQKKAYCKER